MEYNKNIEIGKNKNEEIIESNNLDIENKKEKENIQESGNSNMNINNSGNKNKDVFLSKYYNHCPLLIKK